MASENVVRHFYAAVQRVPHRIAIAHKQQEITFEGLQQAVLAQTRIYRESGLKTGDRVLVFVPMSIELYIHVLALFHMGCTAVFLDEWSNMNRLKLACKIAQCKAFIGIPVARLLGWFVGDIRRIPIWIPNKNWRENQNHGARMSFENPVEIDANSETALITFTTGSTQIPKAAKRTHGFLDAQFSALQRTLKTQDTVVDMPVLPIVLLINLGEGITSVIAEWKSSKPHTLNPSIIANQWQKHGVTRVISSPYFIDQMARFCVTHPDCGGSITEIFSGGAPVFPDSAERWNIAFPQAKSTIVYGSTEAEPISEVDAKALSIKDPSRDQGLCVGRVVDVADVAIIPITSEPIEPSGEAEMSALCLKNAQVGEIIVRGNHVLTEYFNNPEALRVNKIRYGNTCWHRTGDSGFLGDDGNLYLTGRASMIFMHLDRYIYPFIQEHVIQQIPGVTIGTLLQIKQGIVYFIETEPDADLQSVANHVNQLQPPPTEIRWGKIPRDKRHNTKIDYQKILAQFA